MGFFTKLEKLSEKYIEGFFKTKFAEHIQPAEIAKLILREMRNNKTVSVSHTYVPNNYSVHLGKEDWQNIEPVKTTLSKEMQDFVKQKAESKGYHMLGEVKVSFELEETLGLGSISVKSSFSEELPQLSSPDTNSLKAGEGTIVAEKERFYQSGTELASYGTISRQEVSTKLPRATLVRKIGAREAAEFPLSIYSVVIGRRRTNDICIDDNNVSRVQASIDYAQGSYFITDLGSTNGTFVNGVKISKKKLSEGDLIRMGTTILEFKVV